MPPIGPIRRSTLIRYLHRLGWTGPYPGRKHALMQRGTAAVHIPNQPEGDISRALLLRILAEAGIDRAIWEAL